MGEMKYRVEPTTEIIEGKVCERMHFLDACAKYPKKRIVYMHSECKTIDPQTPNDFICTIYGVYPLENQPDIPVLLDLMDKGYDDARRRMTTWEDGAKIWA